MEMKILVAEDEEDIRNLIREQLTIEGYEVILAGDGFEALEIFQSMKPDLALLDIMMPRLNGMQVLKKIRETSNMPVIFVTARGEEYDRVLGLSEGADDYLVKPFSLAELSARVTVQKRHIGFTQSEENNNTSDSMHQVIFAGDLKMDFTQGVIYKKGVPLTLNAKEYLILQYFAQNANKVVTKRQIYQAVWGQEYLYDDNTIMVQISHLRNKIEEDGVKYIQTLKGIGYRFAWEEKTE